MTLPRRRRVPWVALLIAGVVLMAGAVAFAVAVGKAHRAARQHAALCHAQVLGLAFHNFKVGSGHLPPQYPDAVREEKGHAPHSWMTDLLPSLDNAALYRRIDRSLEWTDPCQRAAFETPIDVFRRPDHDMTRVDGYGASHFAVNRELWRPGRPMKLDDIRDGVEQTVLIGTVAGRERAWGDPDAARDLTLGINRSPEGFGSPGMSAGTAVAMASGAARFLSDKTSPEILRKLATPAGRETLRDDEF